MKTDNRKVTGVRITTGENNGKFVLFLHRTAKSGPQQNARHTAIKPIKAKIISDLEPTVIGDAVLKILNLDKS